MAPGSSAKQVTEGLWENQQRFHFWRSRCFSFLRCQATRGADIPASSSASGRFGGVHRTGTTRRRTTHTHRHRSSFRRRRCMSSRRQLRPRLRRPPGITVPAPGPTIRPFRHAQRHGWRSRRGQSEGADAHAAVGNPRLSWGRPSGHRPQNFWRRRSEIQYAVAQNRKSGETVGAQGVGAGTEEKPSRNRSGPVARGNDRGRVEVLPSAGREGEVGLRARAYRLPALPASCRAKGQARPLHRARPLSPIAQQSRRAAAEHAPRP